MQRLPTIYTEDPFGIRPAKQEVASAMQMLGLSHQGMNHIGQVLTRSAKLDAKL